MYRPLLLSISLLPLLGLAVPTTAGSTTTRGEENALQQSRSPAAALAAPRYISGRDGAGSFLNTTKLLNTVNGFPDPEVHCSGRLLSDSGDTDYASDLNIAVTASSDDGVYGACNVNGDGVDGNGALAFKSGTVQVYFCNHAFAGTSCDLNEYWRADALITGSCGADGGGWVTISDWSLTIGRDPTNSDGSFRSECGDSLHGVNENFAVRNSTG